MYEVTYTSVSMAWSLVTLEKWVSRMVTVPVRATWPHPQNRATPEKQRIVATSDAYGTPPKHLMQHSKQPVEKKKHKEEIWISDKCHLISWNSDCFTLKGNIINISPQFHIRDCVLLAGWKVISEKWSMRWTFIWVIHSSIKPIPAHPAQITSLSQGHMNHFVTNNNKWHFVCCQETGQHWLFTYISKEKKEVTQTEQKSLF